MPDDRPFDVTTIDGLDTLFAELEGRCQTSAIVTVTAPVGGPFTFDLKRTTAGIEYGYEPGHHSMIQARLLRSIVDGGGAAITIRSFTDRTHPGTQLPYKELRGYRAWVDDGCIEFEQLSAEDVFASYTEDADSGESIDPEPEAIYCGPEHRIRGEDR